MAKDYSQLSKEELLSIVERLESRKKYGLIWDEEKVKEQFEKDAQNAFPVLKEIKTKKIVDKEDQLKSINILVQGDNYHALSVFNFTHQNKIDVIYIDPPYNTGNKDFIYNDHFVDREDSFRHSKWLSFMDKRLRLAKNLLNENGIIFISIDDNEHANLKLLCDEIFGGDNFIANFIWQKKTGASDAKNIATITEYVLCYVKQNNEPFFTKNSESYDEKRYRYRDSHFAERGNYYIDNLDRGGLQYSDSLNYGITCPDGTIAFPNGRKEYKNDGWIWKWSKRKIEWALKNDFLEFRKSASKASGWSVCYKNYMFVDNENKPISRSAPYKNLITNILNTHGTSDLQAIFGGKVFSGPKPVDFIKFFIKLHPNKNAIALDFFAGSGTTGQAVMELNEDDGGSRSFILVTNNESGICEKITYPRIKKVIKGYSGKKNVGGTGGNLLYFKTSFVKNSLAKDDMKMRLSNECTEMLCLREGIFDEVKSTTDYKVFKQNDKILAVYYSLERDSLKKLKKEMDKLEGEKVLYCFTLDPLGLGKSDFIGWKDIILEPIPQKILDVYKQIYEY